MMNYLGAQNGQIKIYESEDLSVIDNYILVDVSYSAVSPGTENTMSQGSQEEVVRLGYSASGTVNSVGNGADDFKVGDRVAVYGAPYVGHRSQLLVPKTLAVKVPESVSLKDASLGGLGAIAIHGLRQGDLRFGEICVVVGLGIYGQLIAQIAHNAGLVVFALNRSASRAELLQEVSGLKTYSDEDELEKDLMLASGGKGADAVFLCAGSGASYLTDKSIDWLCDRGKSVIVGDIQPNYSREKMFVKEIDIRISRAGGPGRYNTSYEKDAVDYPYGYVRWTEGRNVGEFIRLLEAKRIKVDAYYDMPTPIETYPEVYKTLSERGASYLTHCFTYGKNQDLEEEKV